jgi:HTH-type transcriptional regulator, sugar sensing transcriptional regulator
METNLLEDIGLTKSEIKVYLALLELGLSSTGKIVDKSKASSSKIYEILDRLIQKGLVSYIIKSGVKYFEAADPKQIMDYVQEKENKLQKQKENIKELIPKLKLKQNLSKYKSEATIFKGIKGFKTAMEEVLTTLKKGEEYYVIGTTTPSEEVLRFFKHFHTKRSKKGIKVKILFSEEGKAFAENIKNLPRTKIKFAPTQFMAYSFLLMYKDKTLINVITKEDVTTFKIENKDATESFKSQFHQLWNQDVIVEKGIKKVYSAWNNMLDELKPGEEYCVMGASWQGHKKELQDFFKRFHEKRIKKKVKSKFLFVSGTEKVIEKNKEFYKTLAEVKFLPEGVYEGIQFNLYKNKVLMFVWKEKEPAVFTIEDKKIFQTFKTYFDTLWGQKTRILTGVDAVQQIFDEMLEAGHADFMAAKGYFVDVRPNYVDEWEKRAIKNGFTMRNIVGEDTKGHRITKFSFAKTKYNLPPEFANLSVFWIYGNKVVISNWMGKEPIVIIIENKRLFNVYKQQFELLWNKKIT